MDEKTNTQNLDDQDEVFDMSEENATAFDEEDEDFDMPEENATLFSEMLEQQNSDESDKYKSFAAKFSEEWVIGLPDDTKKVNTIISTQLAKKAKRA